MLEIYTVAQAKGSILQRENALDLAVTPGLQASLDRLFGQGATPETAVVHLIAEVRTGGDDAIRDWTRRIDGLELPVLRVSAGEIAAALARTPEDLVEALQIAAARIRQFHALQPIPSWTTNAMGGTLGQRFTAVASAGVYVPGGTAPLPSSLLMSAIPAQVAGVERIAIATPPGRPDGHVPDVILAAAAVAGLDEIYVVGGALAVAALAYGTATIPRVDKIVGPGNLFTTLAKRQVYGVVGIDGLYGPTETAVVADDSANPAWVAADMLAQAEHDVLASALLFTPSRALAKAVQAEAARQMEHLSRAETISVALAHRGGIVLTTDLAEAFQLASDFAAEHTCIATRDAAAQIDQIRHAGGLFIGERSFEVLGDYVAGPSHTMPTSGTARFASPLNVLDFVKISSIIHLDEDTSARLSPIAARLAEAEALTAHAAAARYRVADDSTSA